jgi:hypothetical protein
MSQEAQVEEDDLDMNGDAEGHRRGGPLTIDGSCRTGVWDGRTPCSNNPDRQDAPTWRVIEPSFFFWGEGIRTKLVSPFRWPLITCDPADSGWGTLEVTRAKQRFFCFSGRTNAASSAFWCLGLKDISWC